jgi:hypothetical protein
MRRGLLSSAPLLAALAVVGTFTSGSLAAGIAGLTSVKYTAIYTDGLYGPVSCAGQHQTAEAFPGNETTGGRDVWTCRSTTGKPLTNAVPGQLVRKNVGSDYFYFVKHLEVVGTAKERISSTGRSYSAIAYWPWP